MAEFAVTYNSTSSLFGARSERETMTSRLDVVLSDAVRDSIPPRAIEWVRQWIAKSSDDDLAGWWIFPVEGVGLRLEKYACGRDESVVVEADTLSYHWMHLASGAWWWCVVGIDPPHEVTECDGGSQNTEAE